MLVPTRFIYKVVALFSVAVGVIGAILPLLPTTPFLLVACWAATKGAPELKKWLLSHQHFGPALRGWHEKKAIPLAAKYLACTMILSSWAMLWLMQVNIYLMLATSLLFIVLLVFIISRPST